MAAVLPLPHSGTPNAILQCPTGISPCGTPGSHQITFSMLSYAECEVNVCGVQVLFATMLSSLQYGTVLFNLFSFCF
jgi:hypothetical protein